MLTTPESPTAIFCWSGTGNDRMNMLVASGTLETFLIATVLVFIGSISLTVIATWIPVLAWLVGKPQALENKWHYKVAKL